VAVSTEDSRLIAVFIINKQ